MESQAARCDIIFATDLWCVAERWTDRQKCHGNVVLTCGMDARQNNVVVTA